MLAIQAYFMIQFTFADHANNEMDRNSVGRPRNNRRSTLFFSTRSTYDPQAASPDKHGFQAAVAAGNVTYLQVPSTKWIPKDDPMSYIGSWTIIDEGWIEKRFLSAPAIDVVKTVANSTPSIRGRNVNFDKEHHPLPHDVSPIVLRLKVVKVGLLSCKDDLLSTGRKSNNKKWRSWSVILTNTQLIFLKDTIWALALGEQIERLGPDLRLSPGTLLLPTFTDFKPDEVIGLNGSAAVFDRSYTKNENTFRLAMPLGLEYMLQANDELEMNEWVTLINWSAASKTLGIPTTNDSSGANLSLNKFDNDQDIASVIAGSFQSERFARAKSVYTHNQGPEPNSSYMELLNLNTANEALLQEYQERSISLMSKIEEELRMARNLELLAILSQSSREHIESLFQLMAENIRRWRAELAKVRSIYIRQRPHQVDTTPHHRDRY
ncbi:hypothetical protein QFC19_002994 [Naganishia cerealis]|uniref:Uncharacterized protein n=1 Tax=Naganishia cerealis TaxID=610337 RepID=A0ACC2W6A3_9TREE|nr:hypothetical protein QFC19_002994 [Naganishia cerealis]